MGVFVLTDQHTLVPMKRAQFVKEKEFQSLLENFPELLSGDTAESDTPQRWLLLNREQQVPAEEGRAGRWAIDHLFVDQDGMPTLVEVKRQTNTDLRRKVVGQMLDYAANAVVYLSIEQLRADFENRYPNPEEEIHDQLGPEVDPEELWQNVKTNLQAGRIRLLFVADQIPDELKRIVEFLNAQMKTAEVLALELQQYEGQGLKTIVPVVYGRTEIARVIKGSRPPGDGASFFDELKRQNDPMTFRVAETLAAWMEKNGKIDFGFGSKTMTMSVGGTPLCRIWTWGQFVIFFKYAPFTEETKRQELLARLNQIDGMNIVVVDITGRARIKTGRAKIKMDSLSEGTVQRLLAVMDWVVDELRRN